MNREAPFNPPVLFVSISFIAGLLNFVDTSVNARATLKPVFFLIQSFGLLLLLTHGLRIPKKQLSDPGLSSFLAVQLILAVATLLLYVDFLFVIVFGVTSLLTYIELALYFCYLLALTGTSFWFALKLSRNERWKWGSVVFAMIGLAFGMAFLERMFFWSQNHLYLVLPGEIALIGMYGPHIFMFLAAISAVFMVVLRGSAKKGSRIHKPLLFLFVPAFVLPVFWSVYKEGLINFVLMGIFDWNLGYVGYEWISVSLYLMMMVSYFLVLRSLSQRLISSVASALILVGAASFPFNGITVLSSNYSSIPGNMVSLNSIILGCSLLAGEGRNATVT